MCSAPDGVVLRGCAAAWEWRIHPPHHLRRHLRSCANDLRSCANET
jgi:hypothetical protein